MIPPCVKRLGACCDRWACKSSCSGLQVELFGTAAEFLKNKSPDVTACLILDIRLPGVSGLDFQVELAAANIHIPIIFITGHGDVPMTVRAMKAGAVEFLTKPFRDQDLFEQFRSRWNAIVCGALRTKPFMNCAITTRR